VSLLTFWLYGFVGTRAQSFLNHNKIGFELLHRHTVIPSHRNEDECPRIGDRVEKGYQEFEGNLEGEINGVPNREVCPSRPERGPHVGSDEKGPVEEHWNNRRDYRKYDEIQSKLVFFQVINPSLHEIQKNQEKFRHKNHGPDIFMAEQAQRV
jgi:hypothetical protein